MFRDIGRNQDNLLPPSLRDLIPDDDLVCTVIDIVDHLDLSKIYSRYHNLGQHAYHPKMMLGLLFYAYTQGIFTSRKIADRIKDSIRFLYLTGYQFPDFRTIARFRKDHQDLIHDYFTQIVRICMKRGLAPLDAISIDGTKIKANASPDIQSKWLLKIAESEDNEKKTPESSPSGYSDSECCALKGIGPGYNAQAAVDASTQLIVGAKVVTDKNDSKQLMPMIDEVNKVTDNTDQAMKVYADTGYSSADVYAKLAKNPMLDPYVPVRESTTHKLDDPYSKEQFKIDIENQTGTCPEGHLLRVYNKQRYNKYGYEYLAFRGTMCHNCKVKPLCTKDKYRKITMLINEPFRQAMRKKMNTPAGKYAMMIRRSTVEPAFGCIKEAMGFRRFKLKGLKAVTAEWLLIAIAFNLKKIHKIQKSLVNSAISLTNLVKKQLFFDFCQCIAQLQCLYKKLKQLTDENDTVYLETEMLL